MTTPTRPAEVTATDFRGDIARILRDAHYGHPTLVTNNGEPFAKVVHPDAANIPGPDDWQAAQQAYDRAANLPNPYTEMQAAYEALGRLLSTYFGHDQEAPDGR